MKNIKDITISIFAIIGFVAIVSGFTNNETEQEHTVPESHVWEMQMTSNGTQSFVFSINKVTGEVRKYESQYTFQKKSYFSQYKASTPMN